jgi:hypothetical protein
MTNLTKIAVVVLRIQAFGLVLYAIIDWGIISAGALLSTSLGLISPLSVAFEARFLQSGFFLLAGIILYLRSRSLAEYFVEGLANDLPDDPPK